MRVSIVFFFSPNREHHIYFKNNNKKKINLQTFSVVPLNSTLNPALAPPTKNFNPESWK